MTVYLAFILAMLCACGVAAWWGGRDERLAALALALAAVITPLAVSRHWAGPEMGVVLVDGALFAALMYIAIGSRAFWPMWATGFQLCGLAVHLAAAMSPHMLPAAYAETLAVWSYAVVLTLLIGTLFEGRVRHGRR
jgi:hypothetical protein